MPTRESALSADLEHPERRAGRCRLRFARDEQRLQHKESSRAGHNDENDEQRSVLTTRQYVRHDGGSHHDASVRDETEQWRHAQCLERPLPIVVAHALE
jgi:hypothetical protein